MAAAWYLLDSGAGPAAENMAWDEALLGSATQTALPLLRFYAWLEPAATFGYFQRFAEVERMTLLRPLLRRPTGGGLVPHAADWTYSLVLPPADAWYSLSAVESYRRVHDWIRAALVRIGLPAELSSSKLREGGAGQCFIGAERFDVLSAGRKIAGAAQRRTKDGLLVQGSIQPPVGLDRRAFQEALLQEATEQWEVAWTTYSPNTAVQRRVQTLVEEKYALQSYHAKR